MKTPDEQLIKRLATSGEKASFPLVAAMRSKLTIEQTHWLNSLSDEQLDYVEQLLLEDGEEFFLANWVLLKNQMIYLETLL